MANPVIFPGEDVVYTALFGDYESLNENRFEQMPTTRYICFTDNKNLKSVTWEIYFIQHNTNPKIASRQVKMFGHRFFPKNTRLLYIDNTVQLKVDGSIVLDEWLENSQLSFMAHSKRKTVRGEFFMCAAYGLEKQKILRDQYNIYLKTNPKILKEKPFWGGMIARLNNEDVDNFMTVWFREYKNNAKRDQLALNMTKFSTRSKIGILKASNSNSKWHRWPVINNRKYENRDTTSTKRYRKMIILFNGLFYGTYFYLKR